MQAPFRRSAAETTPANSDAAGQLHAQQLELLYRQATPATLGAFAAALLTGFLLYGQVPLDHILIWLAVVAVIYGARLVALRRCSGRVADEYCRPRASRRFFLGVFASGLVWGVGSIFLFPEHSLAHQILLLLAVGGLGTGSTVTYSALRWASASFTVPSMSLLAFKFLSLGDSVHVSIGIVVLTYVAILVVAQENAYRAIRNGFRAGLEKATLAEDLQREVEERALTERSLLASQRRLTDAQRIAGFGNWEWDLASGTSIWSDETYRIFRLEPDAAPFDRQTFFSRVHLEDRDAVSERLQAATREGRAFGMAYRIVWPDGTIRHVHDEGEVRRDESGQVTGMAGVIRDITRSVQAEEKIKQSERELSRILDNLQDIYFSADLDGVITRISPSVQKVLGYRPAECLGTPIWQYCVEPGQDGRLREAISRGGGAVLNFEARMRRRDGSRTWLSFNAQYVRDDQGKVIALEGMARDISQLKLAEEAAFKEKERALVTLESIGDGVVTTGRDGIIDYVNPVAERLLQEAARDLRGRYYLDVLHLVDEATGEALDDLVKLCLTREGGVVHANDGVLSHPNGDEYSIKISAAAMRDSRGEIIGAVLVLHDMSEVARMARQLSYQATHDMLTGLVNRHEFETRVERAISDARDGHRNHVLFYMDLDQFKLVNDTCGHRAGDLLLEQLAALMLERIREHDTLARLGGDEFGVLLLDCPLERAEEIAEDIRRTIGEFRYVWEGKAFDIGVSIGVVPIEHGSGRLIDVMSQADAACYVAKDSGRNRVHVYTPDDNAIGKHHGEMEWVHRIYAAFDEERFVLFAQPIVQFGKVPVVTHYEILMRMEGEDGAMIPPGAFIPAAERYNLMPTLDRWVIRTTLGILRQAQGPQPQPPVRCAINLSGQSLCDNHFLDFVVDQFDFTGVPGESVCFEITETAAIANLTRAMRFMSILKGMGCTFALDDFGTGLSSFGYLKNLSVNYLKIDGSFVRDMVGDSVDRAMVGSINQMGHVMGLQTIAEFVEDDDIVHELMRMGVDMGQGYGLGRPAPLASVLQEYTPVANVIGQSK